MLGRYLPLNSDYFLKKYRSIYGMHDRRDNLSPRRSQSPWHVASTNPFRKNYGVTFRSGEDSALRSSLSPMNRVSHPRVPPLPPYHQNDASSDRWRPNPGVSWGLPSEPNAGVRNPQKERGNWTDPFHDYQSIARNPKPEFRVWGDYDIERQRDYPYSLDGHLHRHDLPPILNHGSDNQERYLSSSTDSRRNLRREHFVENLDPRMLPADHIFRAVHFPKFSTKGRPVHDLRPHSHDHPPTGRGSSYKNTREKFPADPIFGDAVRWETKLKKRHNSLPSLHDWKDPGLHQRYSYWREKTGLWNDAPYQDTLSLRFLADSSHAASFIERFIHSCVEGLLVDVAAEVLVESKELQDILDRTSRPVISAAKDVLQECLNEELISAAKEVRDAAVISYWKDVAVDPTILYPVRDDLLNVMINSELRSVAVDAIGELVNDYLAESNVVDVYMGIYDSVAEDLLFGVVRETLLDSSVESIIIDLIDGEINSAAGSFMTDASFFQTPPSSELRLGAGHAVPQDLPGLPDDEELQDSGEEAELAGLSETSLSMTPAAKNP